MCELKVRFSQSPERRSVFECAFKAEVVAATGISKKIFVYHQSPAGIDGNTYAEFDHVATPVDMHEIPEDAASATVPWYRTDKCTVWLRNVADMETAKQLFMDDIRQLQKGYDVLVDEDGYVRQMTVDFTGGVVSVEGAKEAVAPETSLPS